MLRFGLVLLVATSALAAPSYEWQSLNLVPENAVGPVKNSGRANHIIDRVFRLTDDGDASVNVITLKNIVNDLATLPDPASQAMALGQAIGITMAHATGRPGDACISAALIQSYNSGNADDIRRHLKKFISHIGSNLELLVRLVTNPQSARSAVGPQSSCPGEGRTYDIEAAWDAILASANKNNYGLLNESYCTAKRLYCALSARSNNVAAVVTASSLPPVVQVYEYAFGAFVNLFNALAGNGNYAQALGGARQAIDQAVLKVSL